MFFILISRGLNESAVRVVFVLNWMVVLIGGTKTSSYLMTLHLTTIRFP